MLDRLVPSNLADVIRREIVHHAEARHRLRIADERLPMVGVVALQLIEVLREGPDNHAETRHEAVSLRDRVQFADGPELIQHEKRRKLRFAIPPRATARIAIETMSLSQRA